MHAPGQATCLSDSPGSSTPFLPVPVEVPWKRQHPPPTQPVSFSDHKTPRRPHDRSPECAECQNVDPPVYLPKIWSLGTTIGGPLLSGSREEDEYAENESHGVQYGMCTQR